MSVVSSPSPDTAPLPNFYWFSISAAQKKIYMMYPYLIPHRHIMDAIIERARAGVIVKILLPSKHTDARVIAWASAAYYETLLKAGVEIYEYQPTLLHTKVIIIDDVWSVIGSANMDTRSKESNEENIFGILDASLGTRLDQVFFSDLAHTKKVMFKEWRHRHLLVRLLGQLLLIFIKQY